MTKKTPKPQKKSEKKCPYCNGEGDRIEECLACMGHGCFECDGQGYIAWECEYCQRKDEK
jgi:DnaJ-class molecular chaperone